MGLTRIVGVLGFGVLAALHACSSGTHRSVEDAVAVAPRGDAAGALDAAILAGDAGPAPSSGSAAVATSTSTSTTGDIQVRVEWRDIPAAMRSSPGRTPCASPRTPAVAPTTTWGIPDALVIVESAPAAAATASPEARVALADCTLVPRVAVGGAIEIASAVDRPTRLVLTKRGEVSKLTTLTPGPRRIVRLPIAGHAVAVTLEPDGIYELATDDKQPETSWIVAPPVASRAAVTDAAGQVIVRDVPVGTHPVLAWFPPRAGHPGRFARGTVTVEPGDLAEITLQLVAR